MSPRRIFHRQEYFIAKKNISLPRKIFLSHEKNFYCQEKYFFPPRNIEYWPVLLHDFGSFNEGLPVI